MDVLTTPIHIIDRFSQLKSTLYIETNLPVNDIFMVNFFGLGGSWLGATLKEEGNTFVSYRAGLFDNVSEVQTIASSIAQNENALYHAFSTDLPNNPLKFTLAVGEPTTDIAELFDNSYTSVSGTVTQDSNPVAKTVRCFAYDSKVADIDGLVYTANKPLGEVTSSSIDGSYTVPIFSSYLKDVFVVIVDDIGSVFKEGAAVAVGDKIYPTVFNGYTYECTLAGVLPGTEPASWDETDGNSITIGTSDFTVVTVVQPQVEGPITPILNNSWLPTDLFVNSSGGAWYDPSDLTTLFQDSSGTTPVTLDGDPVGMIQDKSGYGAHAIQTSAANRPTYRTDGTLHWLEFTGSHWLEFPQQISGTQDRSIWWGSRPFSLSGSSDCNPIMTLQEDSGVGGGQDFALTHESSGVWVRVNGNSQWGVPLVVNNDFGFFVEWSPSFGPDADSIRLLENNTEYPNLGGSVVAIDTKVTANSLIGSAPQQVNAKMNGRMYALVMVDKLTAEIDQYFIKNFIDEKIGRP